MEGKYGFVLIHEVDAANLAPGCLDSGLKSKIFNRGQISRIHLAHPVESLEALTLQVIAMRFRSLH
jgi:hypothetical protein